MLELLKRLCDVSGVSGSEETLAKIIIGEIAPFCEVKTDALGNVIAYKKGKSAAKMKLMIDAHMDEVGLMVTYICEDGRLRFSNVGGIDTRVLLGRKVKIGETVGVIGVKPVHLIEKSEKLAVPKKDSLFIDIGARDKADAERVVKIGDTAVFGSEFFEFGEGKIASKAFDNRIGCMVLIEMIKKEQPYDLVFSFSVQEELGLRGARTAAYGTTPQAAIIVECTTAADIAGVAKDNQVCVLGDGAAVSFMDGGTVYDKAFYEMAFEVAKMLNVKCQPKAAVAGGNNSGAIHLSKTGVRTIAVSVPCRYLHAPFGVVAIEDIEATAKIVEGLAVRILDE